MFKLPTSSTSKSKAPKCFNDKTCNKHGKSDYHYMTDCPHTSKEAAVEMLAKHRAAREDKPKEAFKTVEPAKKVGRVLFKAKNTSLAKMARMEGKLGGKTIVGVLDTGATSSAVTRSFVTMLQDEGTPSQLTEDARAAQVQASTRRARLQWHRNRCRVRRL
jgi:hypothetical protein